MSTTSSSTPAGPSLSNQLDAHGFIAMEIPCRKCRYALRGLLADGVCPECGIDVRGTLRGDLLSFSEPGWITSLADGCVWIIVAAVMWLPCALGEFAAEQKPWIGAALGLIPAALNLVGYLMVTRTEPAAAETPSAQAVRRGVRWCAVAYAAVSLVRLVIAIVFPPGAEWIELAGMVMTIPWIFLTFGLFRSLARRIPSGPLVAWTTTLIRTFAVGYILGVLTLCFYSQGGGLADAGPVPFFIPVGVIWTIAWIVWLVLLFAFRFKFRQSAILALGAAATPDAK